MSKFEVVDLFTDQYLEMVNLLHELCLINSGTYNLPGLAKMHTALSRLYKPYADKIESKKLPAFPSVDMNGNLQSIQCGDALFVQKRPELKRRILITGHMDTVYPVDSKFQTLSNISDTILQGPGVADMKGGLIVMLYALQIFEQLPAAKNMGWDVLINSDEEIGSPVSASLLVDLSKNYQAALVYEPAMNKDGVFAKNRRGSGKFTLVARGKAAHVGRNFTDGRNAICYLAEAILAIHKLNNLKPGITFNLGLIKGGEALNMVPDTAVVKIDVRISTPEDKMWVEQQLNAIVAKLQRDDYQLNLSGSFGRPVKCINQSTIKLFERIQLTGQKLGLHSSWQDSGGCCDGNNLSSNGLPVIDTLGVRGGNIHSVEEYIMLDSLVERAALSTLLLQDLAEGGLEEL